MANSIMYAQLKNEKMKDVEGEANQKIVFQQ